MMTDLLAGRTAVVTGAASGIGRAIARRFAEQGADVVIADLRRESRRDELPTDDLIRKEADVEARFVQCDVTDRAELEAAMDECEDLGGVDIMVNNAGIIQLEDFLELTDEEFQRIMDVNVNGVFLGSQLAARRMAETDGGSIINMSSMAGLEGAGDYVAYSTSKGAVRIMTYAIADALSGTGIRVNAIHPGPVRTAITENDIPLVGTDSESAVIQNIPVRRMGEPNDIANAALFLASELADFVNGQSLLVDGGMFHTRGEMVGE